MEGFLHAGADFWASTNQLLFWLEDSLDFTKWFAKYQSPRSTELSSVGRRRPDHVPSFASSITTMSLAQE